MCPFLSSHTPGNTESHSSGQGREWPCECHTVPGERAEASFPHRDNSLQLGLCLSSESWVKRAGWGHSEILICGQLLWHISIVIFAGFVCLTGSETGLELAM